MEKVIIESEEDFDSIYKSGISNRKETSDDQGKLSQRAATVLVLEIAQTIGNGADGKVGQWPGNTLSATWDSIAIA